MSGVINSTKRIVLFIFVLLVNQYTSYYITYTITMSTRKKGDKKVGFAADSKTATATSADSGKNNSNSNNTGPGTTTGTTGTTTTTTTTTGASVDVGSPNNELQLNEDRVFRKLYKDGMLQTKLHEAQTTNKRLNARIEELKLTMEKQMDKQRDIIRYLHREIQEKNSGIEELKQNVEHLESTQQVKDKQVQRKFEQQQNEFEDRMRATEKVLSSYQEKYEVLKKFTEEKV
jgi:hypothetical protein